MRNLSSYKLIFSSFLIAALGVSALTSCQGNTDGDERRSDSLVGERYVADGGAGATITIDAPKDIAVGEQEAFSVTLTDPQGQPMPYVRVFCESEKGIGILEPSSGGVAFEHTGSRGVMSGVLGGVVPGSYLLECRGPEGYGLIARTTIVIVGPIPDGFTGFTGAAGGNLGGGYLVDVTPETDDSEDGLGGIRVARVTFTDGPDESTSGPIDVHQGVCDNGTATDPSDDFFEPWFFNDYRVVVKNDTSEKITIGTIGFTIRDSTTSSTSTQQKTVVIEQGEEGTLDGLLTDLQGTGVKMFAGGTDVVKVGTYRVDFVITGYTEEGTNFVLSRSVTLTFDYVNRCDDK